MADAVLRSTLYDPVQANVDAVGMYTLLHMVEDSFADSHVARRYSDGKIIYLKPWNLRTWWSYFIALPGSPHDAARLHFSESHHQTREPRDFGYLLGAGTDDDECASEPPPAGKPDPCDEGHAGWGSGLAWREKSAAPGQNRRKYQQAVDQCLTDMGRLLNRAVSPADLKGEAVVPSSCLSRRALEAQAAVEELLLLVARHVASVVPDRNSRGARTTLRVRQEGCDPSASAEPAKRCFAQDWALYRKRFLAHGIRA